MEVNVKDYLSNEEIKEMVIDGVRSAIQKDCERLLSNFAHSQVHTFVDDAISDEHKKNINLNIDRVISNLSEYTVFRKKDAWGSDDSIAYSYLQNSMKENKELVFNKVEKTIREFNYENLIQASVGEFVCEFLDEKLSGKR